WFARMGWTSLAVMRNAADAEAQVLSMFELGSAAGQPDAPLAYGAQLGNARYHDGRLVEIVETMEGAVEAQPHISAWRASLARTYCEIERFAEGREEIDILRRDGFRPPVNWSWTAYMVCLADAVCDVRDPSAAAAVYAALLPVAGQVDVLAATVACGG